MSFSFFTPRAVVCWCLVIASPAVVVAQPSVVPMSSEYVLNATGGDQLAASACIDASGGFVVWQDNSVNSKGLRVMAAPLDAGLNAGNAFPISAKYKSKKAGDQENARVATLPDGSVAFAWQGGKPGAQQIYARFRKPTGKLAGGDKRVSTQRKRSLSQPQLVALNGGNAVIVFTSEGGDGSMKGIFGRVFSSKGKPLTKEFQINQTTAYNQKDPSVAALPNGGFVVTWVSELQRGPASIDIYCRTFDSLGQPVSGELPVNATTNSACGAPAVAASPNGDFAVCWQERLDALNNAPSNPNNPTDASASDPSNIRASAPASPDLLDIYVTLFDANGGVVAEAERVNSYTTGDQYKPSISANPNGYFIVWTSLSQTNNGVVDPYEGVFGQWVSATGELGGDTDVHVNEQTMQRQLMPAVVSDNAGHALVLWSSIASNNAHLRLVGRKYFEP